jgi:uncharacterized membrane protein YphA (DoxX/SURF4 family)
LTQAGSEKIGFCARRSRSIVVTDSSSNAISSNGVVHRSSGTSLFGLLRRGAGLGAALTLARYVLGLIFVVAGVSKILQPYEFLSSVYAYGLVGPSAGFCAAWLLPWLEITVGGAFLLGACQAGAALVSVLLSVLFMYVKLLAIHQDRQIGCGCIVTAERGVIGIGDLAWAIGMFGLTSVVYLCSWSKLQSRRRSPEIQSGA